ncbi:hypothetical protein CC80DRAFT_128215 [Byssothecium circinans]|uniref:Uncharacterized protein n=1 Tax=Byssothecium circinans TaxID=147558 RepID=A0A6A5TQY1_9PLEO|nr:hypothetical protein CC80DRAFT_128215 [Byssothecium circinans]
MCRKHKHLPRSFFSLRVGPCQGFRFPFPRASITTLTALRLGHFSSFGWLLGFGVWPGYLGFPVFRASVGLYRTMWRRGSTEIRVTRG